MTSHLIFLMVAGAFAPQPLVPVEFPGGAVIICGDLEVAVGEKVRLQVLFECIGGFLQVVNPYLSPEHHIPASVLIFGHDFQKLAELTESAQPDSVATNIVLIRQFRAVGRTFEIKTGMELAIEPLVLKSGIYYVQVTYFESLLQDKPDSVKVLCRSKLHRLVVR